MTVKEEEELRKLYKSVRNNSRMLLYTNEMGRPDEDNCQEQICRDDMWAISTSELDEIVALFKALSQQHEREIAVLKKQHSDFVDRMKLEFDAVVCDCGEPWSQTDGADVVNKEHARLHHE